VSQEGLPKRHSRFRDRRGLDAWSTLLTFFNLIRTAVAAVLEPVSLSNDELLVLICLAHAGGALSMGAIQRSTLLQAGRLRRVVDELEARRLVAWRRSRADRRKVLVRMTRAGRQLTDSLSPVIFELIRRVTEPVGQESTEFMRAKMRKILSSAAVDAAVDLEGMYSDHRHDDPLPLAPDVASNPGVRSAQRPPTWGLAGWLRCCQWSGHVDRIWRREFRNLGLTVPRLQVLAVLSGAAEGMTVDAIASATGLPQVMVTSTLSVLEQTGLVTGSRDEAQPRARLFKLTKRGEQKVLEALPMANRLAEDLYQGLSNEDLVRLLSLLPKLCGSAWQTGQHYSAARRLTSTTSTQ
jgi:DNA-binding MarR family transcriptional regulator